MSTSIKQIVGIQEHMFLSNKTMPCKLNLTRFWGGAENKTMLQLTIANNTQGYIQLTKDQVYELAQVLLESFNKEKYPSE